MLPALVLLLVPVVIVDVTGDRLDPSHTRELVEKELSVTAVAPDDPRAATATGRIEVKSNATDKKLTVKYRKVDEPVERTIDLSDDTARAESDAALLAGNLARDEASELAPPPAKPAPPKKAEKAVKSNEISIASVWSDEDRELAHIDAFLKHTTDEDHSARTRTGIIELAIAGALIAPAVFFLIRGDTSTEERAYMGGATTAGGALIGAGIATMLIQPNELEPIQKKIREHNGVGTDSKTALEDVDREWAKLAADAKRGRTIYGWMSVGLGAALMATGGAGIIAGEGAPSSFGVTFAALGGMFLVNGIATLTGESVTERSYRTWHTFRTTEARGPNVSFGATVLPGGGGAASFALTF
jgi:hypothetical protein